MKRFADRRRLLAGAAGAAGLTLAGCAAAPQSTDRAGTALDVGLLLAGRRDDRGFMEAGYRGLERARTELGVRTRVVDGLAPQRDALAAALTTLAQGGAQLVIAHGAQNNEAAADVAPRFPATRFVVTQGAVSGANLASYDVLQEDSAYLAGVLAALSTRSGVVGHMSGIRVRAGLKGRAAYAAGIRDTRPGVRLLTNFSGQQDDNALSERVARAQAAAGADIIFTMLNAGRDGVTKVCRERGIRQIGNVIDWVAVDPQVFIASAVADVGAGVFDAVRDTAAGRFPAGQVRHIGLAHGQAVRLTMAADVSDAARSRVATAADAIRSGRIKVPEQYDGAEFATPA